MQILVNMHQRLQRSHWGLWKTGLMQFKQLESSSWNNSLTYLTLLWLNAIMLTFLASFIYSRKCQGTWFPGTSVFMDQCFFGQIWRSPFKSISLCFKQIIIYWRQPCCCLLCFRGKVSSAHTLCQCKNVWNAHRAWKTPLTLHLICCLFLFIVICLPCTAKHLLTV